MHQDDDEYSVENKDEELSLLFPRYAEFRPDDERRFMPWLAVLASRRIPYRVVYRGDEAWIRVPLRRAEAASLELMTYEERNRDWPPPEGEMQSSGSTQKAFVSDASFASFMLFFAVLFRFFLWVENHDGLGEWNRLGVWDRDLVLKGEWWRNLTALTLHSDAPHMFSNMFWGFGLGSLVGTEVGVGAGLLGMVLSGFLGNWLMAFLGVSGHRSLGASTMVFELLGMLAALHTWRGVTLIRGHRGSLVRVIPWTPLIASVAMMSLYGAAPGTDVLGHACGFALGVIIGLAWRIMKVWTLTRGTQFLLGLLSILLLVLGWVYALA